LGAENEVNLGSAIWKISFRRAKDAIEENLQASVKSPVSREERSQFGAILTHFQIINTCHVSRAKADAHGPAARAEFRARRAGEVNFFVLGEKFSWLGSGKVLEKIKVRRGNRTAALHRERVNLVNKLYQTK
jgi:hypothetical protein